MPKDNEIDLYEVDTEDLISELEDRGYTVKSEDGYQEELDEHQAELDDLAITDASSAATAILRMHPDYNSTGNHMGLVNVINNYLLSIGLSAGEL